MTVRWLPLELSVLRMSTKLKNLLDVATDCFSSDYLLSVVRYLLQFVLSAMLRILNSVFFAFCFIIYL